MQQGAGRLPVGGNRDAVMAPVNELEGEASISHADPCITIAHGTVDVDGSDVVLAHSLAMGHALISEG